MARAFPIECKSIHALGGVSSKEIFEEKVWELQVSAEVT